MAGSAQDAYCTLLTNDGYLPGAMVLAHSLRDNGTRKQIVVLVTLDTLSASTIEELKTVYHQIIPVDRIVNTTPANLYLMNRPDLSSTFTKILLWRQTQFRRIVYIDSDVVALRAPDELFALESTFAAAPDVGWPDCFNSGVMALTPNMGDYYALLALAQRGISFDGADQGLLNMHFRDWERFSFAYNCTPSGHYQYVPAYKHFQSSISMVHFIGKEKPWTMGRDAKGAGGAYDELLGRWWAVFDRHYRAPTTARTAGQAQPSSRTVQEHVKGESHTFDYGYPSMPQSIASTAHEPEPKMSHTSVEEPSVNKVEVGESTTHVQADPEPAEQARRFSAPQAEWDPTRQPPPAKSRPEASNFPSHQYTMSSDRALFHPPPAYPAAPKDMWYEVPQSQPTTAERPKPIFPWEATQTKATRVFAEDSPPSPEPTPSATGSASEPAPESPPTPTSPTTQASSAEPFESYSRTNAWDEVPEIERYVRALNTHRRGRVQVLHHDPTDAPEPSPSATATAPATAATDAGAEAQHTRRPSFRLTDFPTAVERPSLPVTPAAVRRPSFWGDDRDETELPPAHGVPRQQDWDPLSKLEELRRRQSEALGQGQGLSGDGQRELPDRELVRSAVDVGAEGKEGAGVPRPTSEETEVPMSTASEGARFHGVRFDAGGKSGEEEAVFSPTES